MPNQQPFSTKQNFPLRLYAAAFVISLLATVFSGWQMWQMHHRVEDLSEKRAALVEVVGSIMLYDEVLTMSARMAAATGDFSYEKRYDEFDPQLTREIDELRAILPQADMAEFVRETDEANNALVEIERQAFALAHQGKRQAATALLISAEYKRLKNIYAGGMQKTVNAATELIERESQHLDSMSRWSAAASAVSVLVLLAVWFFSVRSARSWATERREAEGALVKIQDKLLRHREQLEQEVAQRTLSLTEAQRIAHIGNWELDVVNNRLDWSDEIYNIFGLTPQQFDASYEAFLQAVHPEDRQLVEDCVRETLELGHPYSIDHRIQLPDGTVRHVHEQAEVFRNDKGEPLRMQGTVQDITEHKLAEEAIRQQHELTTQIIETIPMRIFWKDRDLHYLGCNTLFAKDAGLIRSDQLIGKTDFDMGWKDQAEIYRADDRRVIDANTSKLSYDEPQTTPDGGQIWLRTSKVPLRDVANESVGVLGVYEDITTYKQMELRLLESEERFRKAFQYSAIGMALVGLDGRWLKVNDSLCQIVGYPEQELLGKTFQDITHPDDLQIDLDFVAQLLAGEIDHYQMEKRYLHKDGHVVWIRLSVSLIRDTHDQPIHFVSQIDDITQDKLAEEMVRASEARFRKLFENSNDAIFIHTLSGELLDANAQAERLLGYPLDTLKTMSVMQYSPPEDAEIGKRAFAETRAKGYVRFECRFRQASGSLIDVEVSSRIVDAEKGVVQGIVRDITERKLAEEKIRQLNEELENKVLVRTKQLLAAQEELVRKEKLAVLGQVAGSVGHELRNPLGVMSNAVYFLQTVLSEADETTTEYLNIIKSEIAASERIVSDLLDSVRTKPPHAEIVGVMELINQTLRKLTLPPSVSVKLDIPETLPPLRADAQQIHQVFRNLISNGAEAMLEGGVLEISAVENKQDKSITISVRDSGSGITPEALPKLFQPLFTTKARGIGLGLVVVKNLTQANGGKVEVQSEPGKGTTFSVTLPAADELEK